MRRRGIARKMIDLLAGYAEKCDVCSILLEVRQSNTPARTLYEDIGFKAVGVRKNYYKNPVENAILMDLRIKKKENKDEE
jgi:ribosomal-protein-alanine N-acetyltransferase